MMFQCLADDGDRDIVVPVSFTLLYMSFAVALSVHQILSHDSESIATAMQSLKKADNWLSSFLESYSPPIDGERYLTDQELSEHLKLSHRTLQEYRK